MVPLNEIGTKEGLNLMIKKYPRNSICPCGSGKKYKNCCITKDFDWVIEDGVIKKSIKMDEMVMEALKKQHQRFIDAFGREPGPNDPIFFEQYLRSDEEHEKMMIDILTQIKADPAIIYAYRKTQRIVTKENKNKLTDLELEEWQDAIDEYYDSIDDNLSDDKVSMAVVESIVAIEEELKNSLMIFSLIIFRCGETDIFEDDSLDKYEIQDYVLFCVTKTFKTLKSILLQSEKGLIEDALVMVRTIYESYLSLILILHKPEKLNDLIARAGLATGTHEYAQNKKGKPDRRKIIDKSTGLEFDGIISTYQMALSSDFEVDIAIHDDMYEYLSNYTHPSTFTLENYLHVKSFNPSKPNDPYEVIILSIFIVTIFLDELQLFGAFDQTTRQDINRYVTRIKPILLKLFENLINIGEPGNLVPLLLERTTRINIRNNLYIM